MDDLDRLVARVDELEVELRLVRTDLARLQSGAPDSSSASVSAPRSAVAPPVSAAPTAQSGAGAAPGTPARRPPSGPSLRDRLGSGEIEFLLGGNILGKLGLVALVLAAGWFIRFAFENHWINESGRIYTGLVIGFAMVGFGLRLSSRAFRLLGPALTGAGFSVLYIAFFGAFYFYALLGRSESFVGLFLLSALLAFLAMRADSRLLYLFSLMGAFLAPILLSSGENSYRFLFLYATVINLGYFGISARRAWRGISLFVLAANATLFFAWFSSHGTRSSFLIPYLYLLVLYVGLIVREQMLFPRIRKLLFWDNHAAVFGTHLVFFLGTLNLAGAYHPDWTAHLMLLAACFQIAFAFYLPRFQESVPEPVFQLAWSLAIAAYVVWVFAALTEFFDGRLLSMSWIALAGTLSVAGARLRSKRIIFAALLLWVIALFRLLFLEGRPPDYRLVFNERFGLFALAGLLLAATYWIQRARPLSGWMRAFGFAAIGILVIGTLAENHDFIRDRHYRNLGYSYVLAGYAFVLLVPGFLWSRPSARWSGMVLALMVVAKLYLYDVWTMSLLVRIISFASLGVTLVVVSYYYQRFRERLFPGGDKS